MSEPVDADRVELLRPSVLDERLAGFVAGQVLDSDGDPIPTKKLTVKLTADGTDIDDLIIEDI